MTTTTTTTTTKLGDKNNNGDPTKTTTNGNTTTSPLPGQQQQNQQSPEAVAKWYYTQQLNSAYGDLEHILMKRVNESNQKRFRLVLISIVVIVVWVVAVFGKMLRKMLSDETAGLARETLENEALKSQTQELAMAVVQTVLNDSEVNTNAAAFLRGAAAAPETQQALLQLVLHVLQHPESLAEVTVLAKKLIAILATDKVGG